MYKPKRITLVFAAVLLFLLIWPVAAVVFTIEPRVFGLPFAVFWELLLIAILGVGMLVLTFTVDK